MRYEHLGDPHRKKQSARFRLAFEQLEERLAPAANFAATVVAPPSLTATNSAFITVEYQNTGTAPMAAPVLQFTASQNGNLGGFLTLDPTLKNEAFNTNSTPAGFGQSVQILASGSTPGILEPGESATVTVYYGGWLSSQWSAATPAVAFTVGLLSADNTTTIDWASMEAGMQPPSIPSAAWPAVFANLATQMGSTWGSYVQALDADAAYLGPLGENVSDVNTLWALEIQRAIGLGPVQQLASATDMAVPVPGVPLALGRVFSASVIGRNLAGPFGQGWELAGGWGQSLAVQSDGSVIITQPDGSQLQFTPAGNGYTSPTGDYDTLANVGNGIFTLTQPDGQVTEFANGQVAYVQDTNGNRVTAGYTGALLTSLTASSGPSITISYNAAGLISSVASSLGQVTTYSYDATNQYLASVAGPTGQTTTYSYNTTSGSPAQNALTTIAFPGGTHQYFTYDSEGLLSGTSNDGGAQPQTFAYAQGQVSVTDGVGNTSELDYNEQGLLFKSIDPLGNVTLDAYDSGFNLVKVTNALGLSETYTYNSVGEATASTDFLGNTTQFVYAGPFNQLASMTDANDNTTQYTYSSAGDLLSTTYANGTSSTSTFNPQGDATSFLNQNGQATNYTYNAAGQVLTETFADGSQYTYTYNSLGAMVTATDATGTTTFTYDSTTQLLTKVAYPTGMYLTFTYNAAGQRTTMVDQTGFTVNYSYDSVGRLSGLTDGSGNPIVTYTYDADGRLSEKTNGNGTKTTYQYDANGNVLHLINYASDGSINSQFDYTYNALELQTSEATLDGSWTYTYDADGQLTHAVFASTNPSVPSQDLAYSYDAMGNRITTVINGTTTAYVSNNVNEYTSVGGVADTYDKDGNLLSDGTNTYTYNELNQLVSVVGPSGTTTFTYNALGQQVAVTTNGQATQYLIDPSGLGNVVEQYTGSGALVADYTYGLGLTSQVTTAGSYYYDFDALGSTAGLTNALGTYVDKYSYLPFGASLTTQTVSNPFQFVGYSGVMTEANGLLFMRARYETSAVGRFISTDPSEILAPNLYAYAGNNATTLVDPTGLDTATSDGAIGKLGWLGVGQDVVDLFNGKNNWFGTSLDMSALLYKNPVVAAGGDAVGIYNGTNDNWIGTSLDFSAVLYANPEVAVVAGIYNATWTVLGWEQNGLKWIVNAIRNSSAPPDTPSQQQGVDLPNTTGNTSQNYYDATNDADTQPIDRTDIFANGDSQTLGIGTDGDVANIVTISPQSDGHDSVTMSGQGAQVAEDNASITVAAGASGTIGGDGNTITAQDGCNISITTGDITFNVANSCTINIDPSGQSGTTLYVNMSGGATTLINNAPNDATINASGTGALQTQGDQGFQINTADDSNIAVIGSNCAITAGTNSLCAVNGANDTLTTAGGDSATTDDQNTSAFAYNDVLYGASQIANMFGSELGEMIAGNNPFAKAGGAAIGSAVVNNLLQLAGVDTPWLSNNITSNIESQASFNSALNAALGQQGSSVVGALEGNALSTLSSLLLADAGQKLGISGFAGVAFTSAGTSIASQVLSNVTAAVQQGQDLNQLTPAALLDAISWSTVLTSIGNELGDYLSSQIGGGLFDPTNVSEELFDLVGGTSLAAAGGEIGSAVADALANEVCLTGGIASIVDGALDGTVLGDVFGTALGGLLLPGVGALLGTVIGDAIGTVVYSFLNDITGGLFSNLFSSSPWEYQFITFDPTTNQLDAPASLDFAKDTTATLRQGTYSLTDAYIGTVNNIIASIGTVDPASFRPADTLNGAAFFAYVNSSKYWGANDYQVVFGEEPYNVNEDGNPAAIVQMAVQYELTQLSFSSGDVMRIRAFNAWKASVTNPEDGQSLDALMSDLQIADDYTQYLANSTTINTLMASSPDSAFATGWVAVLLQADALGLNQTTQITVTSTNDDGPGSLRQAIIQANDAPGGANIVFSISPSDPGYNASYTGMIGEPASGAWVIQLDSPLQTIENETGPITISGLPGDESTTLSAPEIVLDGSAAGSGAFGLILGSNACDVEGLGIVHFSSGGILITGTADNRIVSNYIGENTGPSGLGSGILVTGGTFQNSIESNVIVDNSGAGIDFRGVGTNNNVVSGNRIGASADGTFAVPNSGPGVLIEQGASQNLLDNNVISGNANHGVYITGVGTDDNQLTNNMIGVQANGLSPLPNQGDGVFVRDYAHGTQIGGTDADNGNVDGGDGNIISGNAQSGIETDSTASLTWIGYNTIGLQSTGLVALPNSLYGIFVHGGANEDDIENNIISGNTLAGVFISGAGTDSNVLRGNFIGTTSDGIEALGNGDAGVSIAAGASDNLLDNNVISGNDSHGVYISDTGTNDNQLTNNTIGEDVTGTFAIANQGDGVFVGGGASGTAIGGVTSASANIIGGNVQSGVEVAGTTILTQIASNLIGLSATGMSAIPNVLYGVFVHAGANGSSIDDNTISGNTLAGVFLSDTGTYSNVVLGNFIGTTPDGTQALGNGDAGVLIENGAQSNLLDDNVISGNDAHGVYITGAGTNNNQLTNNRIGEDVTGTFAIPNQGDGIFVRAGAQGTVIGGSTSASGNVIGGNAQNGVEVDSGATQTEIENDLIGLDASGASAVPNAENGVFLHGGASGSTIADSTISGNTLAGVYLSDAGTDSNVVQGNLIGTTPDGTKAIGNGGEGVLVVGGASQNLFADNTVSGNALAGFSLSGTGTDSNVLRGNFIGTTSDGTKALGNGGDGVSLANGADSTLLDENVISGNDGNGVSLTDPNTIANQLTNNTIGEDVSGTFALPNQDDGIYVGGGARDTVIGGSTSASGNVIGGNKENGVELDTGATETRVTNNLIGLSAAGTTPVQNALSVLLIHAGVTESIIASNTVSGPTFVGPVTPTVTVSDSGGIYTGLTFPASAIASASDGTTVYSSAPSTLVPAYFYPSPGGSPWDQLTAAAATSPIMAIMNPDSGPGTAVDPNYVSAVNKLRAAGGKVIGYVDTDYATIPLATVEAEIDSYRAWYNLDGIFIDEMTSAATPDALAYYQAIYNYVHAAESSWIVVGNPGTNAAEAYAQYPVADVLVVYEDGSGYDTYAPPSWEQNYGASHFANIVYDVTSTATMQAYVNEAESEGTGWLYVTDGPSPNPYAALPSYWSQFLAAEAASQDMTGTSDQPMTGSFTYVYTDSVGQTSNVAPTSPGTYSVTATFTSSNPNYSNAVSTPVVFTIAQPTATITVDATQVTQTVPTNFVGTNVALWDPLGTTAQTQALVQAAGIGAIRIPGGSAADTFHFDVAPTPGSGASSLAEMAQYVAALGATGIVTLNYGTGSPQEAAAEIAYLDGSPSDTTVIGVGQQWSDASSSWVSVDWHTVGYWASLRAASPLAIDDGLNFLRIDRSASFGFQYFEVGNEVYGANPAYAAQEGTVPWETDEHASPGDPATYVAFAKQLQTVADEINPAVKLGIDADITYSSAWVASVLQQAVLQQFTVGWISDHYYLQQPGTENDDTLLAANPWAARAASYEGLLQTYLGAAGSQVPLLLTEFNSVSSDPGNQTTNLANGLFFANTYGSLLQTTYQVAVSWDEHDGWATGNNNIESDATGGWRLGGDYGLLGPANADPSQEPATGPNVPYPTYFADQLISKFAQAGDTVFQVSSDNPLLSAYAVQQPNGQLNLLVVNTSSINDLTGQFQISGLTPQAEANVWQYGIAQDVAQSQSTDGDSALTNFNTMLSVTGSSFSYLFPASSMTVLNLQQAVSVTVNPLNITYGTALADSQLSGMASYDLNGMVVQVPGTFQYTSAAGLVLPASSTPYMEAVTFTPTDSTDFSSATASVSILVEAAPVVVGAFASGTTWNA
jgi:RHS repeat-associated protein